MEMVYEQKADGEKKPQANRALSRSGAKREKVPKGFV